MTKSPSQPTLTASEPRSALRRLAPLLVFVVAVAAFWPATSQGFAALDDDYNFFYQTQWAGLDDAHLHWMWTTSWLGHWQPLSWISLAFDLERSGGLAATSPNPMAVAAALEQSGVPQAMHQTNLALHALGAVFLFYVLRRLLALAFERELEDRTIEVAALLAALFHAIHPLRVESVAWATERRDVLSGMFLLASLAAWLRSRVVAGGAWKALSLLLFALSLMSKAWGITFPVVLIALEIFPLRRLARDPSAKLWRILLEQWPYFVLAAAAAGVAAWAQNESAAVVPWNEHGLLQRTAQAAYGLVFYVWKTTWPTDLSPMYILERDLDPSRVKYVVSMVLVAVVGIACLGSRKRLPGVVTTLAVYAVVVSPVLGFLQSGAQLVADRYTYLACIPLAALFAALLVVAARKQALAVWLGVVPLPILFALTWRQTQVWSDPVVFYERVVAVEPDNYIGQHNLAAQIRIRSDRAPVDRNAELRRAVEHELLSIQAHPVRGNEGARHDLGVLYLLLGERAKTEEAWRECVRVSPDNVQCLEELWNLLLSRGDLAGATALFEQALVAQPPNLGVRELYANLLVKRGDRANAERIWRDGLAAEPRWVVGLVGHAECALNQSRMGEAEAELRQALALDGRNVEGWVLLGRALRGQRKVTEAEQCWQTALLLAPGHPGATALLEKSRQESAAGR